MKFGVSAAAYAARGFYVFPCRSRGKEPLTEHGEHDATTDLGTIEAWARRWPRANVAIVPGLSGLFVLDVDVRVYGDDSLRALPKLPDTATALTGGGGLHLWYQRPEELDGRRTKTLAIDGIQNSGIDIKGVCSGYVIVPPSIHPNGRQYVWECSSRVDEVPIAMPPRWLIDRIRQSGKRAIEYTPLSMPVEPESFALGVMFKRAGLLGRQIKNGVFAVTCPNAAAHGKSKHVSESATVIFAPEKPGGRGTFFCSHTSGCADFFR